MDTIIYHGAITPKGVLQAERILSSYVAKNADAIKIHIVSGGGDSGSGSALYSLIKAVPMEVHTYASGLCASGGVTLFVAGQRRFASPATMFMLHGSQAPDGSLSRHAEVLRRIYEHEMEWDAATMDGFFSSTDENWFTVQRATDLGLVTDVAQFSIDKGSTAHVIEV